ncbi:MAG: hypothetical protein RLZZ306_1666, partial [Bacteroidota bacterium]
KLFKLIFENEKEWFLCQDELQKPQFSIAK